MAGFGQIKAGECLNNALTSGRLGSEYAKSVSATNKAVSDSILYDEDCQCVMSCEDAWAAEERIDRHRGQKARAGVGTGGVVGPQGVPLGQLRYSPRALETRLASALKAALVGTQERLYARQDVLDRSYPARRRESDPEYQQACKLRGFVNRHLGREDAGAVVTKEFKRLTGLCPRGLFLRLTSQMPAGMSWSDRKAFHIDHIKPCCSFNLLDEAQARACFHYSNLRPIWAKENRDKIKFDKLQRIDRKHATGGVN